MLDDPADLLKRIFTKSGIKLRYSVHSKISKCIAGEQISQIDRDQKLDPFLLLHTGRFFFLQGVVSRSFSTENVVVKYFEKARLCILRFYSF